MPLAGFKDLLSEVLKLDKLFFSPVFSLRFGLLCKLSCMFSMTFFSFPFLFLCFPFHNMFFCSWLLFGFSLTQLFATLTTVFQLGTLAGCLFVGWLVG